MNKDWRCRIGWHRLAIRRNPESGDSAMVYWECRRGAKPKVVTGVLATAAVVLLALATGCGGGTGTVDAEEIAAQIEPEIEAFLETVDRYDQVRAVLVYHDGEPVLERYTDATPGDYWDLRSVTKSVMATLIGIAIDRAQIESVDQTLGELLPSYATDLTPDVAAITLREVLTHTAGFRAEGASGDAYWESPDWIRTILAHRAADGPGDGSFAYSSQGAHLLSAILVEATGQPVLEYARENLFEPLGIPSEPALETVVFDAVVDPADVIAYNEADFAWPTDPQGYHDGAGFLKLRPQDLAVLGLLYLDGGRWGDEQVVPESWTEEATTAHVERTDEGHGYGYLWWTTEADGDPAYFARGLGGQLIEVVPGRNLVVVVATEYDELDPLRHNKDVDAATLALMVDQAIAPHVPRRG